MSTSFTEHQRLAIEHLGAALVIVGGPGSGKTRVMTERVRWLIAEGHAGAFGTLVVTFSNRAARELAARLREALPAETVAKLHVQTISSFCLELLSTFGDLLGYAVGNKRLRVAAAEDAREMLAAALGGAIGRSPVATASRLSLDAVASAISKAKFAGIGPARYAEQAREPAERAIADAYAAYQTRLLAANALDYGDLILQSLELLEQHTDARTFAHDAFTNVLVDEFQDVSFAEWRILQAVCGPAARVTVAGDAEQTIHSWRGAMGAQCFERFRDRYPGAAVIALIENHRSGRHIVAVSRCLADAHRPVACARDGAPVVLLRASSEHEEAALVATALDALVKTRFAGYADCAVMCRTNAQVDAMEKALLRAGIPYRIVGQGALFHHAAVRGLLAHLAMALDPCDDYAARQVARLRFTRAEIDALRGDDPELTSDHLTAQNAAGDPALAAKVAYFNALAAQLAEFAEANPAPADAINRVLALAPELAASERAAERIALLKGLAQPHATIDAFLREVELWSGDDPLSPAGRDQVAVMTLHAAKGLEFKACFVIGANEGVLPHFNVATPAEVADERRLMYVGVTRGADLTVVTYARERHGRPAAPSRFLQGWPGDSVVRLDRGQGVAYLAALRPEARP